MWVLTNNKVKSEKAEKLNLFTTSTHLKPIRRLQIKTNDRKYNFKAFKYGISQTMSKIFLRNGVHITYKIFYWTLELADFLQCLIVPLDFIYVHGQVLREQDKHSFSLQLKSFLTSVVSQEIYSPVSHRSCMKPFFAALSTVELLCNTF